MNKHLTALAAALLLPIAGAQAASLEPIRVILVGDSTMASRSGYGDALCQRFTPEVTCVNLARGGRSSASFRKEGRWAEVQSMLRDGGKYKASYVLVQFGHNDQPGKPGRSTDLVTEFPVNMASYVTEARALGGVPVLVTPLTRRSFKGDYLRDDLAPWAAATRKVAQENHAVLLDLNADSAAAVQQMGQEEADTLAMAPPPPKAAAPTDLNKAEPVGTPKSAFDRTHLGKKGSALFSGMVAKELVQAVPDIAPYLKQQ
ncbi:rhamnogalacturonan acetylesterase [Massilia terrae]|uniref:Rhamnogalacturonan acetylesterase n=1 Tax=Massilia terrae TaxID=1811224 RepID=A0ABT2CX58_9BURK|nr:rhamnogalacturonan acetylesterase [Massilia terrae]MCS0657785.1 rhamnogalacturonan acetylesterase [Massilia terrae]